MTTEPQQRRRVVAEIWIVLGLSLGASAVYAVVSLVAKLTAGPLSEQTASLNASQSPRPYLDLTYQLLSIGFALVPVALALWLLAGRDLGRGEGVRRLLGLDSSRPVADLAWGALLAAVIGLPGIGLYLVGRALDLTATVVPAPLDGYWWTVPVLILSALKNAVLEEVVVVGYLMVRLRDLGWGTWSTIAASAALRGAYHLYQGIGAGFGNLVMGVVFGWYFHRFGRVMPLVVAHTILDVVAFVGYALLRDTLGLP